MLAVDSLSSHMSPRRLAATSRRTYTLNPRRRPVVITQRLAGTSLLHDQNTNCARRSRVARKFFPAARGGPNPEDLPLPFPSFSPFPPSPSFPSPLPTSPPFLSSLLEVGPLKSSYKVWESAVSSPSMIRGRAPTEIEFGALCPENMRSGCNNFNYFPEIQLTKFSAVKQ